MSASDASATVRILTKCAKRKRRGLPPFPSQRSCGLNRRRGAVEHRFSFRHCWRVLRVRQTGTVSNPHLWYSNASIYGKPYMYKVYHIVKVGGATVDVFTSPLASGTLTWDTNFPIFNGHPHYLWGAAQRYDYPAPGTAGTGRNNCGAMPKYSPIAADDGCGPAIPPARTNSLKRRCVWRLHHHNPAAMTKGRL